MCEVSKKKTEQKSKKRGRKLEAQIGKQPSPKKSSSQRSNPPSLNPSFPAIVDYAKGTVVCRRCSSCFVILCPICVMCVEKEGGVSEQAVCQSTPTRRKPFHYHSKQPCPLLILNFPQLNPIPWPLLALSMPWTPNRRRQPLVVGGRWWLRRPRGWWPQGAVARVRVVGWRSIAVAKRGMVPARMADLYCPGLDGMTRTTIEGATINSVGVVEAAADRVDLNQLVAHSVVESNWSSDHWSEWECRWRWLVSRCSCAKCKRSCDIWLLDASQEELDSGDEMRTDDMCN